MGLIIIPLIGFVFLIILIAIFRLFKLSHKDLISYQHVFVGFVVNVLLLLFVTLKYYLDGEYYVFNPVFTILFFVIMLPFVISIISSFANNKILRFTSKVLLVSVALSLVTALIYCVYFSSIMEKLGVAKYY